MNTIINYVHIYNIKVLSKHLTCISAHLPVLLSSIITDTEYLHGLFYFSCCRVSKGRCIDVLVMLCVIEPADILTFEMHYNLFFTELISYLIQKP